MMNLTCLMDHILFQTYIIKKHETILDNSPIQIYVNRIKTRIAFKIKTGYKLELLSPETRKLLGSVEKDVDQDKDGKNVQKLESIEVVLVHCNLDNYQQASKILLNFVPNKQFGQSINKSPHSLPMLNTTNTKFSSIELWFTDQNSK